mmetsp:Transcript_9382/g.23013  ORF Transcript_9382/g.23013 Transcript_9382/m.23013 type:complete len:246 (+) Transcript_9382:53-790(+)|eukprot:CAMPEP_0180145672 /NCGR_PEP_ID=MMETSP0986-20121125/17867_1 /TAXON_ID=697907 /ORGANISM="non described non described, Strain CCMP2293" /LENGTH=245 /DNA_ID=CAMNT_0022090209 /DNA_START=53 /DNA_END=790 /DNA_ORIENTATION=+
MGLDKMSTYAFKLIGRVQDGDLYGVWKFLRDGVPPDGAYIGITALQVATENANVEMVVLLLMFGADPESVTTSRAKGAGYQSGGENCTMIAERLLKSSMTKGDPEKRKARQTISKYFVDKEAVAKAADVLKPKLTELEKAYNESMNAWGTTYITFTICLLLTIVILHVALHFYPAVAVKFIPEALISDCYRFSPVFLGHNPFKGRQSIGAGDARFYEKDGVVKHHLPQEAAAPPKEEPLFVSSEL